MTQEDSGDQEEPLDLPDWLGCLARSPPDLPPPRGQSTAQADLISDWSDSLKVILLDGIREILQKSPLILKILFD